MKKIFSLLAFVAFACSVSAQTTTATEKTEKVGCAKGEAKAGCCAGKAKAAAEANAAAMPETANTTNAAPTASQGEGEQVATEVAGADAKPAGCCAGKAKAAKSCHGSTAQATESEAAPVEHECSAACKDGAHHH